MCSFGSLSWSQHNLSLSHMGVIYSFLCSVISSCDSLGLLPRIKCFMSVQQKRTAPPMHVDQKARCQTVLLGGLNTKVGFTCGKGSLSPFLPLFTLFFFLALENVNLILCYFPFTDH